MCIVGLMCCLHTCRLYVCVFMYVRRCVTGRKTNSWVLSVNSLFKRIHSENRSSPTGCYKDDGCDDYINNCVSASQCLYMRGLDTFRWKKVSEKRGRQRVFRRSVICGTEVIFSLGKKDVEPSNESPPFWLIPLHLVG